MKINTPVRHRLALWLSSALLLALLGLAGCGLSATRTHVFTAAEILQNATNVLDVSGASATHPSSSATVKDLTFTLKFSVDMKSASSSPNAQQLKETMTATGKETLQPRRTQMDMAMAMDIPGLSTGRQSITMSIIVDYASKTGYVKISGLNALLGTSSGDKWISMSFASLDGLGADTSMYIDYSKLKNAKLIGSDTINGVAVWHLRATEDVEQSAPGLGGATTGEGTGTTAGGGFGMNATTDYYFRKDNYRPVKVLIAGTDTFSGSNTLTMNGEMDFTSFNTGISITLPAPSDVQSLKI